MTSRDLALLRHLAEKAMGAIDTHSGISVTFSMNRKDGNGYRWIPWNPLLNANDTLELIAKIDKPMALNREASPDGPWWVSFMHEGGDGHADYEAHGDIFMRAVCEAAGKLTGFKFEEETI